jgi:hypothetical protein
MNKKAIVIWAVIIILGIISAYCLHLLFKDNWEAFFATIGALATASGLLYMLFKETIWAHITQPKFECKVLMDLPYVTQEVPASTVKYWYHIGVQNISGKTAAIGCMCYIDEIYSYSNEKVYERIKNFIPMRLYWAREKDSDGRTFIQPGQQKFVDLGTVDQPFSDPKGRPFCLELRNNYSDFNKFYPGLYKLKILIYSDNGKALPINLFIFWNGIWSHKYDEMVQNLIVSTAEDLILNPPGNCNAWKEQ